MKKLTLLFVCAALPFCVFSQSDTLEVEPADTPPVTPEVLAELFPGQGVEIIDWSFQGSTSAAGVFAGGVDAVDIDHGIILSTGNALSAEGTGTMFASSNLSVGGDPDLTALTTAATFDATILTVTFRPMSDTMHFKYAFASEEYPEYVGSAFNDVFGFFVSGPGINGPYTNNAVNIALVPGTTDPVAINTVNDVMNSQFYTDNSMAGADQPIYDGIIDVFMATLPVTPLEVYTLKIAIADAGDSIYDSAVFLESESFSGGNDSLVSNVSSSLYNPYVENESPYPLSFDLSQFPEWNFPFSTSISGTAEEGVDFEIVGLPSTIDQGNAQLDLELKILQDTENEEVEYFKIEFEAQGGFKFPYYFHLNDGMANSLENQLICGGQTDVVLDASSLATNQVFTFENNEDMVIDDIIYSEIEVNGVPADLLIDAALIESICLNIDHSWLGDLDLFLKAPNGRLLKLSTDNGGTCDDYTNTCFSPSANETISEFLHPDSLCMPSEPSPFTGSFQPEDQWRWIENSPVNGTWTLVAIDDTQGFTGTLKDWSITFDTENIFGEPSYLWSTGETSPSITVSPSSTTTYSVTLTHAGHTIVDEALVSISPGSPSTSEVTGTYCENENFSVLVNGTVYDEANPMGMEVIPGGSFTGCDSVINVNLSFFENDTTVLFYEICEGDCVDVNGEIFCGAGEYEVILTNSAGCDSVLLVTLSEPPLIEVENIIIETSCDVQFFTVMFTITGGDPASYAVLPPGSGALTGNTFISNQIACGTGFYSFEVSDDSGCAPVSVAESGIFCECSTEVGTLDEALIEVCHGETFSIPYDTSFEYLDCDDTTSFIIHYGDYIPIAISAIPEFETGGLGADITYFVTAVSGNDDGTGFVNFNDPCTDYSNNVEVNLFQYPSGVFPSGSYSLCESDSMEIPVELNGEAPWTLYFEVNGNPLPPVEGVVDNPYIHYVSPDTSWNVIDLVSVDDANCSGIAFGTASINAQPDPTLTLSAPSAVCSGEFAILQMSFTGFEPFEVVLEINGQPEMLTNLPSEFELLVQIEEDTEISLYDLTDNFGCFSSEVATLFIDALPSPSPDITFTSPVCPNTSDAIQVEFGGTAPYYIAYTVNGSLFFDSVPGNMIDFGSNFDEDTEFQIVSTIDANGCSAAESDVINIDIISPPMPDAGFNSPICPGFDLELFAEGGVTFEWTGPNGFVSDNQMPIIENVTPDQMGEYMVTMVDECDEEATLSVSTFFTCETFEDTVLVGESGQICFDEIISSANLCDPAANISVEVDGNCLNFMGLSAGVDTVCLEVFFDGQDIAAQVFITSLTGTSVGEKAEFSWLNIYPNPASESVKIVWENMEIEKGELFDLAGRRIETLTINGNSSTVALGHLPEGIYLLQFQSPGGSFSKKLTVVR